jgi:hypothetical protein
MAQTKYKNIEDLLSAITNAPKDKEVAFRVETWIMILSEIQSLKDQLESNKVSKDTLKEQITQEIKTDIKLGEEKTLLF